MRQTIQVNPARQMQVDITAFVAAASAGLRTGDPGQLATALTHDRGELLAGFSLPANANWDWTVRLWDAATGAPRAILNGHQERVKAVAFRPHNDFVASASCDETVKLWSVPNRDCSLILRVPGVYEGMHISGAPGLTVVPRAALRALGAA
jgi:WD40 repeat protein